MAKPADTWDPVQYRRFAAERRRPFDELLALVDPAPGGTAVDLGCGTGELTAELHRHLGAASTVGVDTSPAMLEQARTHTVAGLRFELADLATWEPEAPLDVVFANASLQWVPDHPALLARLAGLLVPGGQLAFQVPANHDHPAHTVAAALGAERGLRAVGPAASVPPPEQYATVLHGLGLVDLHVRMQVFGFELPDTAELVEWTRGTLLTGYRGQLEPEQYEAFEAEYRQRLLAELGDRRPYYYPFKRILVHARRPAG